MFSAKQVGNTSDRSVGTLEVVEFSIAIKRSGIEDYMVVRVLAVYVGSHHESMVAFRKRKNKLPTYFVGFFRADFTRFETLSDVVSEYVMSALTSPCYMLVFFLGKHELVVSNAAVTLVRSNEPPVISFVGILDVIYNVGDCRYLVCILFYMN